MIHLEVSLTFSPITAMSLAALLSEAVWTRKNAFPISYSILQQNNMCPVGEQSTALQHLLKELQFSSREKPSTRPV